MTEKNSKNKEDNSIIDKKEVNTSEEETENIKKSGNVCFQIIAALMPVFLLLLFEAGSTVAFYFKDHTVNDKRVNADVYENEGEWPAVFFKELWETRSRWEPYIYWRRRSFSGKFINIDEKGRRYIPETSNSETSSSKPTDSNALKRNTKKSNSVKSIYFFGGSTMWGTGARDTGTIPASAEKALSEKGIATKSYNMAESGFVSTQSLICLQIELRKGLRPDVVVFYDGVNDVYSSYQQNVPGIPQNEFNRIREFNILRTEPWEKGEVSLFAALLSRTRTARLVNGLIRKLRKPTPTNLNRALPDKGENNPAIEAVKIYMENIRILNALADEYGFKALSYWQPTIFHKKALSPYEQGIYDSETSVKSFFNEAYDYAGRSFEELSDSRWKIHDISQIFEEVSSPLFIDFCHTGEQGNNILGKKMADDIAELNL